MNISSPPHLTIVTGASRGMGLAMAQQLLKSGDTVLCISRTTQTALTQQATTAGTALLQWSHDLADGASLSTRLESWLRDMTSSVWASVSLINNAGMIPRIGPLSASDPLDLARALRVGLEAPMQLTAAFLRGTQGWPGQRRVMNISSGLGRRAMASQAGYCAAKAGMDHFTRCVALEEALKPHGAKLCSVAPGVIDTDMQMQLRAADRSDFPDQDSFLRLKADGALTSPEEAARRLLAYLARPDFGSNSVADVRD